MANLTAKNSFNVLIGKTGTFEALATVQITDPTAGTYIDDGQIIAINGDTGAVLAAGDDISVAPSIKLVQRSGNNLTYSARIDGLNVLQYRGKSGTAAVQQVNTVGYNGTSGAIDTTAGTTFSLKITYNFDESLWSTQQNSNFATYTAATPVQNKIADSMAVQLGFGMYPVGGTLVKVERLCNNAGATDGTATTATASNGSATWTLNAAATTFVVGDYLRIDGGATTNAMYKIVALSGTTVTLDEPYQGASGAGKTIEYVTAALGAAADWGIRITGQPLTFGLPPYSDFKYLLMSFIVQPIGFGTTPNAATTAGVHGTGIYEEVATLAWFSRGFEGALNRIIVPLNSATVDAVSGTLYDSITINYVDTTDLSVISGTKPAMQDLFTFIADGAAQTSILLSQLDPWMASTPRAFNAIGSL